MSQKTEKLFERAKVNLEENNHENALRLFNEILNREPGHLKALRNKGLIKLMSGNKEEAENFLLFALEQHSEDDQLHQMLGTFYHNNEAPSKALAQFKKSIDINNDNTLAHKGLGMVYAHYFNEHKKAIRHFSKAIELGDHSPEIYFSRGCSHMICEQMEKAEEDFRQADNLGDSKAGEMIAKYFKP